MMTFSAKVSVLSRSSASLTPRQLTVKASEEFELTCQARLDDRLKEDFQVIHSLTCMVYGSTSNSTLQGNNNKAFSESCKDILIFEGQK